MLRVYELTVLSVIFSLITEKFDFKPKRVTTTFYANNNLGFAIENV